MQFLNNNYQPFTNTIYFLDERIEDLVDVYVNWQEKIFKEYEFGVTEVYETNIESLLKKLAPITLIDNPRVLFISTIGNWVAMIDNGIQGTDASKPTVLAKRLKCKLVRATITKDDCIFLYKNPENNEGDNTRSIWSSKDTRWEFGQIGEPLEFEKTDRYESKTTRDKFDSLLMNHYLSHLGIQINERSFYGDCCRAILVSKEGKLLENEVEFSLSEYQARRANIS